MLLNVKERIPFLKDKTIDEYNQTIFMPSFNLIELYKNANNVDLDINDYNSVIKNIKNKHSNETNYRITKLINYLKQIIFDDEFVGKCINKLILVVNYGKFDIQGKSFAGNIDICGNNYKYALEINFNNITYALEYNEHKIRGKFFLQKHGYTIKYEKYYKKIENLQNRKLYDIDNHIIIENYDKLGNQINTYHKSQVYNYYENENKEKKINSINPDQNYTKQVYVWRCPKNTIIKSIRIKYQYPKDQSDIEDIEKYLIGQNISPNSNKLPSKGNYYPINKALFTDYFSNKCDINALWDEAINYTLIK